MKKNMGKMDQRIRIVLGLVLLSLLFLIEGNLRWLGLIGIILLATGFINFCPIYALFGISTNKNK